MNALGRIVETAVQWFGSPLSANDGSPNQDLYIRIAIIPRIDEEAEEVNAQKLRGWVAVSHPDGKEERVPIESNRRHGIKLELRTLLERYVGKNVEICVFEAKCAEAAAASTFVGELLGCPVRKLSLKWPRRDQYKPFKRPFLGRRFYSFRPDWYEPEEREPILRAINFEDYRV